MNETKQSSWSEAESVYADLCRIWRTEWRNKSYKKALDDEENKKLYEEMCVRIDEGFQTEESARKLVQDDLAAMQEEIRQIKLWSGSTVRSEASIAPGIAARYKENLPRKMAFKVGSQTTLEVVSREEQLKKSLLF